MYVGKWLYAYCLSGLCVTLEYESIFVFRRHVLEISDGIDEPGHIRWQVALCLLLVWIMCYFRIRVYFCFQTTRIRDIRRYRRTRPYTLASGSMPTACLDYVLL